MPSECDFIRLTEGLRDLGGQRVWSLMISLFGDLAQDRGQRIDGPVLSAMMTLLQVKPEAARVALHRLRNDGWIVSQKSGRISRHGLTAKGRAESVAASPRIYASPDAGPQDWHMLLLPDADPVEAERMAAVGFAAVQPRLYVGPADLPAPEGALRMTADTVPDWLRTQIAPEEMRSVYQALLIELETLEADLSTMPELTPIEVAVLRGLIVHNWRRLVLKHPALPHPLVSEDWPGRACHRRIARLLARFPRPALSEIEPQRDAA